MATFTTTSCVDDNAKVSTEAARASILGSCQPSVVLPRNM
jgi:hypothetical protein